MLIFFGTIQSSKLCASISPPNRSYNDRCLCESQRQYQSWKVLSFTFFQWNSQKKYIVTEKCQGWQNLGMSEKLKEKCRCVKCDSSKSKLKELQLIFLIGWYISGDQLGIQKLRIFLCGCEINKGKSRSC